MKEILQQVTKNKDGGYLLNLRAEDLYHRIYENPDETDSVEEPPEWDEEPFKITEGTYAIHGRNGLYITTKGQTKQVKDLESEIGMLETRMDEHGYEEHQIFTDESDAELWYKKHDLMWEEYLSKKEQLEKLNYNKLTISDLTLQPEKATDQEQNMQDEHDFEYLQSRPIRLTIEKDFGITLAELSLLEQFQFLKFLKTVECKDADPVKEFTTKYGTNGLRAFLSLEFFKDGGNALIAFGNRTSPELGKEVMDRYTTVIDASISVSNTLKERFNVSTENKETLEPIAHDMRHNAAKFLYSFVKDRKITPEQFVERLHGRTNDSLIFNSAFRALKTHDEKGIDLEQIKDLTFTSNTKARESMSEQDIERMRAIISKNYEKYPKEFAQKVAASEEDALSKDTSSFYTLRYKGTIVGFDRFDELGATQDGRRKLYCGSLNTDSDFGNGKLGEVLIEQSILKESEQAVIEVDCNPRAIISQRYIKLGFVATQSYNYEGIPSLHIVMDRAMNPSLRTKSISQQEVIERADSGDSTEQEIFQTTPDVPNFSPLERGFVLTQFFNKGVDVYGV